MHEHIPKGALENLPRQTQPAGSACLIRCNYTLITALPLHCWPLLRTSEPQKDLLARGQWKSPRVSGFLCVTTPSADTTSAPQLRFICPLYWKSYAFPATAISLELKLVARASIPALRPALDIFPVILLPSALTHPQTPPDCPSALSLFREQLDSRGSTVL